MTRHMGPIIQKLTSYTKPEVHNILRPRQRRTEPRPESQHAQNIVNFGRVVSEICERTDKQILITILSTLLLGIMKEN